MNAADLPKLQCAEAIGRIAEMPAFLAAALAGRDDAALRRRPGDGPFSLVEHACHLRDLEVDAYQLRVRRILDEELPELAGFDGAKVAEARNYAAQDAHEAARAFAAARRSLIESVAGLTPRQLARQGIFAGKRITLVELLAMIAGHDGEHRAEIERLLAELDSP